VPFAYSDGSVVSFPTRRNVTFIGLRYLIRWN